MLFHVALLLTTVVRSAGLSLHRRASADSQGKQQGTKEAIVFYTRSIDACRGKRLLALLRSRGQGRDVWLLHDRSWSPDRASVGILAKEGLHIAPQPWAPHGNGWDIFANIGLNGDGDQAVVLPQEMSENTTANASFDAAAWTPRSGGAKISVLLWAARSHYDKFWFIEDDVSFTGKWSLIFDDVSHNDADLIAESGVPIARNSAGRLTRCRLNSWRRCPSQGNTVRPFMMRLSKRFVSTLVMSLSNPNGARGMHEVLIPAFCNGLSWCRRFELPSAWIGKVVNAGWGAWFCSRPKGCRKQCTVEGLAHDGGMANPLPNKIFHPAKCSQDECGDPKLGDWALHWVGSSPGRLLF